MKTKKKRAYEIEIVSKMIDLYCHKYHHSKITCPQCQQLKEYAVQRTSLCPFIETKTFCSACKVHCYKPEARRKIIEVMRYSGPRLVFCYPVLVLKHGLVTITQKLKGALK